MYKIEINKYKEPDENGYRGTNDVFEFNVELTDEQVKKLIKSIVEISQSGEE